MDTKSGNKRERITRVEDNSVIKNFILVKPSEIPDADSLKDPLIFNGFIFGVCLKGNIRFKINHRVYSISENEIFTILPNHIFQILEKSEDLMLETLFLSIDYTISMPLHKNFDLLKKIDEFPTQKIQKEDLYDLLEIHSLIAKHHRNERNPYREFMTNGFMYALLMEIGYLYETLSVELSKSRSRQEVLTDMFFNMLLENYVEERSVAFYAERLFLTPKYLSMAVKKVTGHSIIDWINEAVIIEAKRRLKATDHTVLQISEELNFPNPSFFGRFFKQYAGMTPVEYRNC